MGQTIYIQMEYLSSFRAHCIDYRLTEPDVIRFGIDICTALTACHAKGILHRDIKPSNILMDKNGVYKLSDFGVAKNIAKTMSHMSVKGTYSYMAPEIFFSQKIDQRVDIYSLGLTLYRLMNRNREPLLSLEKQIIYYKDREIAFQRRINGEAFPAPIDASAEFSDIILKSHTSVMRKEIML